MRYAGIDECEICNGLGVGVSLYVQGCNNHCEGCFNPETWDFTGGKEWTYSARQHLAQLVKRPYITRLSILGGEPLDSKNIADVAYLALYMKYAVGFNKQLQIWVYTGYTIDDFIGRDGKKKPDVPEELFGSYIQLFDNVDYIVDGMFIKSMKDSSLAFRGSANQRILENRFSFDLANRFADVSESMDNSF